MEGKKGREGKNGREEGKERDVSCWLAVVSKQLHSVEECLVKDQSSTLHPAGEGLGFSHPLLYSALRDLNPYDPSKFLRMRAYRLTFPASSQTQISTRSAIKIQYHSGHEIGP